MIIEGSSYVTQLVRILKPTRVVIVALALAFIIAVWLQTNGTGPNEVQHGSVDSKSLVKETYEIGPVDSKLDEPCLEMARLAEDIGYVQDIREGWLRAYFLGLNQQNVGWKDLDILAEKAKISPQVALSILPQESKENSGESNWLEGLSHAPINTARQVLALIKSEKVHYLKSTFGPDSNNKLYSGVPLLTFVVINSDDADIDLIDMLSDQGIIPTPSDVVFALRAGLSDQLLLRIIDGVDNLSEEWPENADAHITRMIASQYRPLILRSWLNKSNRGYFAVTDDALDVLPVPEGSQLTQATKTVEMLLDAGHENQSRLGYRRLLSWLPNDWINANGELLNAPSDVLAPEMEHWLTYLESGLAEFNARIEKTNEIAQLCPREVEVIAQEGQISVDNRTLGQQFQQFHADSLTFLPYAPTRAFVTAVLDEPLSSKRDELVKLTFDKKWEQSLELIQLFIGTEYEALALDSCISMGVSNNAPFQYFEGLFSYGARIPDNAVSTLSYNRFGGLTVKLIPHGLNLNFVDDRGINALGMLIIETNKYQELGFNQMFPFLLESGVNPKPDGSSLDPLNFALEGTANETSVQYAKLLVDHGAPIEKSHRQQMETLKLAHSARYERIIEYIPELEVSD